MSRQSARFAHRVRRLQDSDADDRSLAYERDGNSLKSDVEGDAAMLPSDGEHHGTILLSDAENHGNMMLSDAEHQGTFWDSEADYHGIMSQSDTEHHGNFWGSEAYHYGAMSGYDTDRHKATVQYDASKYRQEQEDSNHEITYAKEHAQQMPPTYTHYTKAGLLLYHRELMKSNSRKTAFSHVYGHYDFRRTPNSCTSDHWSLRSTPKAGKPGVDWLSLSFHGRSSFAQTNKTLFTNWKPVSNLLIKHSLSGTRCPSLIMQLLQL